MLSTETLKQIRLTNSITRNKSLKKIVSIPLILILVITLIGVGYLAPISVYALSAGGIRTTIASIILSLMLQSGAGVTNTSWLNTLNASYGVESTIGTIEDCIINGLLTESGGSLIDSGLSSAIESASAWTELGLNDIFATTASDAGVTVASGGVNLANTAINVGTAGTIGAFASAAGIGVGIGVLANHIYDKYKANVQAGAMITETNSVLSNIPEGGALSQAEYIQTNNYTFGYRFVYPSGCMGYSYDVTYGIYNFNQDQALLKYSRYQVPPGSGSFTDHNMPSNSVFSFPLGNYDIYKDINFKHFNSQAEFNQFVQDVKNGVKEIPKPVSPDLVNNNGNLRMNEDGDDIGTGDIYGNRDMLPVDENDYNEWAEQANDNYNNGETDETQGEEFNDFVEPYLQGSDPSGPTEPDQPDIPVNNRAEIPDQPDLPDKPDITDAELEEGLSLATSIDLKEVFPFCIPFDLLAILAVFRVTNREAPVIEFTFPDGNQIVLDFSIFNGVAGLMRTLELIAFVVGLAIVTRRLIGA